MHNEIVIYQSEMLSSHMEVRIEDETVWLTVISNDTKQYHVAHWKSI